MLHDVLRLRGGGGDSEASCEDCNIEEFIIFLKNVRSLSSDVRLTELLTEVADLRWDAILINESWRAEREEHDTLDQGHIWLGSGGTAGTRGVGILLHKRWSRYIHRWRAIDERIGLLELNISSVKISLVVVYMPHCGYQDADIQVVYDKLEALHEEARKKKRIFIFGGDWNAEVRSAEDDPAVGKYSNAIGNARGDWLRRWATSEKLVLANTLFKKRWGRLWTHLQHNRARIIDYMGVDIKHRNLIQDAGASKHVDLGSDHRAVKLVLNFLRFEIKKNKHRGSQKATKRRPREHH